MIGISTDITERKQMEEHIHHLAFFDSLTKLPNRRLFEDRLNQAMALSRRSGCFCTLMFADLDNFKPLNDQHGHEAGDLLLVEVADRLRSCGREIDTVARFGGDEFVILISVLDTEKPESTRQALLVAEKIRAALAAPYVINFPNPGNGDETVEHRCSVSIGLTLFTNHEASPAKIVRVADMAMYQAKEAGRNTIRFLELHDESTVPLHAVGAPEASAAPAEKIAPSEINALDAGSFGDLQADAMPDSSARSTEQDGSCHSSSTDR
jgi:diguanylate cyclase (GGDEF)-like protein